MTELHDKLKEVDINKEVYKEAIVNETIKLIEDFEYNIAEIDASRPWGAFFRINNEDADRFIKDFFPGLSLEDAKLGNPNAELSPKILLVSPGQRLSWQYHDRRAERWAFLTDGGYNKSLDDEQGDLCRAESGDVVQFLQGERHRLVGLPNDYTLVAEIWQHLDSDNLSNESDIIRLADDYGR